MDGHMTTADAMPVQCHLVKTLWKQQVIYSLLISCKIQGSVRGFGITSSLNVYKVTENVLTSLTYHCQLYCESEFVDHCLTAMTALLCYTES